MRWYDPRELRKALFQTRQFETQSDDISKMVPRSLHMSDPDRNLVLDHEKFFSSPEGDPEQAAQAVVEPPVGLVDEAESPEGEDVLEDEEELLEELLEGEDSGSDIAEPPRPGFKGGTKAAWTSYALLQGIEVDPSWTLTQIVAACDEGKAAN